MSVTFLVVRVNAFRQDGQFDTSNIELVAAGSDTTAVNRERSFYLRNQHFGSESDF
jgi:hypothetical protein